MIRVLLWAAATLTLSALAVARVLLGEVAE